MGIIIFALVGFIIGEILEYRLSYGNTSAIGGFLIGLLGVFVFLIFSAGVYGFAETETIEAKNYEVLVLNDIYSFDEDVVYYTTENGQIGHQHVEDIEIKHNPNIEKPILKINKSKPKNKILRFLVSPCSEEKYIIELPKEKK